MEIILRAIVMFIALFIIVKVLGQKQIKNLTLYDYILSITIGSIAADSIISLDTPLYDGLIAIIVFALIGYLASLLSLQSHSLEEFIDGEPLVLFENNNFNYPNLDKAKMSVAKVLEHCRLKGCFDINELDSAVLEHCRLKGCFDINELDSAVLEPSGDVSILMKGASQPLTSNDIKNTIQKNSKKQTLSHILVVDGSIDSEELKKSKKTKTWLNNYLKTKHQKLENISLLSIDKNNKVTILSKSIN